MHLRNACAHILSQLTDLVSNIDQDDFIRPSLNLSHATIGQHLRHTLEFFLCFAKGYESGVVNYDKRNHDKSIETDRLMALATIQNIKDFVYTFDERILSLEVGYGDSLVDDVEVLDTTAARELIYNIEHAVHHMAIIKIGVREVAPYLQLPADFGVAASTIRHQQTIAASH